VRGEIAVGGLAAGADGLCGAGRFAARVVELGDGFGLLFRAVGAGSRFAPGRGTGGGFDGFPCTVTVSVKSFFLRVKMNYPAAETAGYPATCTSALKQRQLL